MLSRSDLHGYQNKGVDFIITEKRSFLALDLGLGKTATSLTAIADLLDSCAVERVLVIAPLRVANSVWWQEAGKWKHLQHLRVSVCTGNERKRMAALHADADIFVINRENVPWLVEHYGQCWPFDCVVIDESSSFKNPSAQRVKALKKVAPLTEYMWLLSGTPTSNGLMDLWAQMYMVDFGQRLGRTVTSYRQRFFKQDYSGFSYTLMDGSADKIHALVADKMLSMKVEDYLDMPDRIDITWSVEIPAFVLDQYQTFEKQLLAELPDGEVVTAMNAAVLANKLLQWCNGAVITDAAGNWSELHTAKLEALAEIVEDNPGENLLVAYNYRADLARLQARFPEAVTLGKEQSVIDDWNAGKIKMLLAQPASAGHGLNLQQGGSVIVWFGLNWSLELYQQFNGRLHRQGQSKPVRVIHLVAKDCIDERVMMAVETKGLTQGALLSAVRVVP